MTTTIKILDKSKKWSNSWPYSKIQTHNSYVEIKKQQCKEVIEETFEGFEDKL